MVPKKKNSTKKSKSKIPERFPEEFDYFLFACDLKDKKKVFFPLTDAQLSGRASVRKKEKLLYFFYHRETKEQNKE